MTPFPSDHGVDHGSMMSQLLGCFHKSQEEEQEKEEEHGGGDDAVTFHIITGVC